ncbi:SelT/SelW/SelH family protein [Haloferax sp. MBLA0076]|uniref:SelT/SelW/SelH family protein n=1 Tax=Haloferax litoreum TaxID=2666140 RepID=A0A6A8GBS3_9EURY|nr:MULTISPECIES: Rdx family protein [Haloferax]KAB1191924.1 SelT/SelW/SelH family protein [Haloferax sp. CBA1148]MRX20361.1 SelT/SelW/SelH family protein [Haloferax litoreum]
MTDVEIEYCVPCGFLERAEEIQHTLLQQFGQKLDRVALVTGDHGVLTVTVDGERVWDKSEDEYDPDEVLRRVRPHVGA